MQNDKFKKGKNVWCQKCGKHHLVRAHGVNPCKAPDIPADTSKKMKDMMIRLAKEEGLEFDPLTQKFYKKNEKKRVD